MKLLLSGMLAAAVLAGSALAEPETTAKKVGKGTENVGKTVVHGTTAVGKGASRIYHNGAHAMQKLVAKNTKNKQRKQALLNKAASHYKHAHAKTSQSKKEMNKAGNAADKVTE